MERRARFKDLRSQLNQLPLVVPGKYPTFAELTTRPQPEVEGRGAQSGLSTVLATPIPDIRVELLRDGWIRRLAERRPWAEACDAPRNG